MADVRTDYRVGLKDETQRGAASIKKSLAGLQRAFGAIGVGLSVAGIAAFTTNAARAADDINKLSDRLGVSVEALSEFQFVAQQSGIEFRTFSTGLQRMVRRISEAADETGPAADALKELGVNAKQLSTLEIDQSFEVLAEALSRVDDEYRRVALAQKIFDSEGVAILQTMTQGAEGVRALREEFRQLGGVLDQTTADAGSDLVDSFGRLDAAGQALGNNLLRILGPVLADTINALGQLIPRAVSFALRAFEGLRFVVAGFIRDLANFVGLEDIARSFDNVAQQAKENVIELRDSMTGFAEQTEIAKQAADFLDNSLGKFQPTAKQAAEAAKELAKQQKALADASKEFAAAADAANDKLEAQERALLEVATPAEEFQILVARFRREQEDFGISAEVTARRVTQAYERLTENVTGGVGEVSQQTKDLLEEINSEIDQFSNNITDSLLDLSGGISGIFEDLGKQVLRFFTKQFIGDPLSTVFKGFAKDLFAGGFATGGFIPPGQFGVVGERGPEIAFGGRSGATIAPISGGAPNVIVNNYSGAEVEQPQVSQVDGEYQVEIAVRNSVASSVASGAMRPLGLRPSLTRRG